ncbi:hypothetical protein ACFL1S_02515 [Pseudomonadota bacterium]
MHRLRKQITRLWVDLISLFRVAPRSGKTVYFDLHDIDTIQNNSFGRLTYLLVMLFHENGYTICVRPNRYFMTSLPDLKFKKMILEFDPVITWHRPGSSNQLHISDRVRTGPFTNILLDYSEQFTADDFHRRIPMPYLMHPMIYHLGLHRALQVLRETPTSIRLFFGGNLDPRLYDSTKINENYGKLTRIKVIETLRSGLDNRYKREIRNQKDLQNLADGKHDGFSWISGPELRLPAAEWMALLARCDFFLACPGVSKPMCHNCVEAMSVGTIPVLEYPEFFHPPLVHGINCVVYDGEQDLLKKVNTLCSLDVQTINQLKQGAIDYYETYLTPEAFGRTIAGLKAGDTIAFMASKIANVDQRRLTQGRN